jgi:5-methyltetrahydropteroyltriglutamate--homocysteine methyltransferase
MHYPKYTTTVIGAHSVPDWYEALDRLVAMGQLSMSSLADAQFRATEAAILDQEIADIDVITGGEMHRRTHNRH